MVFAFQWFFFLTRNSHWSLKICRELSRVPSGGHSCNLQRWSPFPGAAICYRYRRSPGQAEGTVAERKVNSLGGSAWRRERPKGNTGVEEAEEHRWDNGKKSGTGSNGGTQDTHLYLKGTETKTETHCRKDPASSVQLNPHPSPKTKLPDWSRPEQSLFRGPGCHHLPEKEMIFQKQKLAL